MSRIGLTSALTRLSYLPPFNATSLTSCLRQQSQCPTTTFLFTRGMAKKSSKQNNLDSRITMIHYALFHPLTPRSLKFGYMRHLRHWTIYRAWQLYKHKLKARRDTELERQWSKMREACEELKRVDERLFNIATSKKGVGEFPIELRIPTDTPSRDGWNEGWKKGGN